MAWGAGKLVWGERSSAAQTELGQEPEDRKASRTMSQRVLRNIRVQYISDDVTVRYFDPIPPPQRVLRNVRVQYISDDVTVRYFDPIRAVTQPSPAGSPAQPVNR